MQDVGLLICVVCFLWVALLFASVVGAEGEANGYQQKLCGSGVAFARNGIARYAAAATATIHVYGQAHYGSSEGKVSKVEMYRTAGRLYVVLGVVQEALLKGLVQKKCGCCGLKNAHCACEMHLGFGKKIQCCAKKVDIAYGSRVKYVRTVWSTLPCLQGKRLGFF